jgi:V/A-type H+-transporting ATPase subunit E
MSELETLLEKEILSELDDILAQADSRSKEIIETAEREASARLAACRRRVDTKSRAAEQRARSGAELTLSTAAMKAKGEVMERLRERVLSALSEAPSRPGYGKVLEALAEEAISAVDSAQSVAANPEDLDKLTQWALRRGLELREDPAIRLGVQITCSDGRTIVNTLPVRFHRAWDTLASEVADLIWE